MHSRYLRLESLAVQHGSHSPLPLPRRWTTAERRAWLSGADAQTGGLPLSANPHSQADGDLSEALELAWFRGWDDTAAQDMSPIREICGGEGGGA